MKKGKFSLFVAILFLTLGAVLLTLGLLNSKNLLEPSFITTFLTLINEKLSITGSVMGAVELSVFFLVEGAVILLFRLKKPYSMFITVYLVPLYLTALSEYRVKHSLPLPSFIPESVKSAKASLLFMLLVLEILLAALLLFVLRGADEKWRKKRNLQLRMLEKEGVIKSKETIESEKILKRERKLNEKMERERQKEEERFSLEFDKKEKAEKKREEKEREKERREYEKKREKEERRREKSLSKEEKKKLLERDRLIEKEEIEKEKTEKKEEKENKKRKKDEKKREKEEEKERKKNVTLDLGPMPEYDAPSGSPDTPLSFPSFEEMPHFTTIGHHNQCVEEDRIEEKRENLIESSSFMDNLKSEIEKEEEESKVENKPFRGGGMLEAVLESYSSEPSSSSPVNTRPIIGLDERNEKREEAKAPSSGIAPSFIDKNHPRYKLFENLQNNSTGDTPSTQNEKVKEEKDEHIAPSYINENHPRYKMFESLQNNNSGSTPSALHEEKSNEEKEEHIAPSYISENHPRYKMFESLHNTPSNDTSTQESERVKEKKEEHIAPSYISEDHPRYKLFESLQKDGEKSTGYGLFNSANPEDSSTASTVSYTPGRSFVPEDESVVPNPYEDVSKIVPEEKVERQEEKIDDEDKPYNPYPPVNDVKESSIVVEEKKKEETFIPPEMPKVRNIETKDDGTRVFETKSEEEVADDFNLIVGVGDLASNRGGLTAIEMRQRTVYTPPDVSLLKDYPKVSQEIDYYTQEQGETIVRTLAEQKVIVELSAIVKGPAVTMYELKLAQGMIISKIKAREDEINYALGGKKVRILAPVPGKQAVGIEVPNAKISIVGFKDMIYAKQEHPEYKNFGVPMILGRTVTGNPIVIDVAKMPHMIIAGTTGSGKSVCINTFINTILFEKSPKDVRLILVDPKVVELTIYNGIPHLLTPVITDSKRALKALDWLVSEMERRYAMLAHYGVRNVKGLNEKIASGEVRGVEKIPFIVLIMDEFADIMAVVGKEMDAAISRIAAKARAAGIHLILATQRPSSDVILGTLKSNLPGRIAFAVSSGINSRVILDEMGAENLLGKGDMLLLDPSSMGTQRIQGAFLSDDEVEKISSFVAQHNSKAEFLEESVFEETEDLSDDDEEFFDDDGDEDLYEAAKKIVYERKSASASYLQRRLKIGYNRAARIVEQMEEDGIVGPANGSKPREILKFE